MVERVFLLAGRSLLGIITDARVQWPEAEIIVVGDPLDTLTPTGARTGPDRFKGLTGRAVLVANGGSTALQVAAVLAAAEGDVAIVDLQPDRLTVLRRPGGACWDYKGLALWVTL